MKILRTDAKSKDDKKLMYKLTRSPEAVKLSTLSGQRIDVLHYAFYEDEKKEGEVTNILSMLTPEGEVFATNSDSVQREFLNVLEFFEDDLAADGGYIPIRIVEGKSKNGRTFYTCTYAD